MLASYGSREGVLQALSALAGGTLPALLRERVVEDTLRGAEGAKRSWTETGMVMNVSAGLEAVTVPVTAVIGDRDQVEHESALRKVFARVLPQTTFRVPNGIGHVSPLEAPDGIVEASKPFSIDSKLGPTHDQLLCPRHPLFQQLRSCHSNRAC
jgi:pimeloyl-ACP methyl ester carboxylesterase